LTGGTAVSLAAFTSIPFVVDLLKPDTSTTSVYVAGRTPAKLKIPADEVTVDRAGDAGALQKQVDFG
jgi:hypothetical protein